MIQAAVQATQEAGAIVAAEAIAVAGARGRLVLSQI